MGDPSDDVFAVPSERGRAFGQRLAEARKRAGYGSQTALARRMGLHKLTVHKHESQGCLPSRQVLEHYAFLLGVTPQFLLYGQDDPLLDLPAVVRDHLVAERDRMAVEVFERMQRVPWHVIGGDDIDPLDVFTIRALVERNLAKRDARARPAASYRRSHAQQPEQLPIRGLDTRAPTPEPGVRRPRHRDAFRQAAV